MILKLTNFLVKWCEKRGRVLEITGTSGKDDVYLIRYYLVRSKYMNLFIHQFLRSDIDHLHDHPWYFMTYLVQGSYSERKWNDEKEMIEVTRRSNKSSNCRVFRDCSLRQNRLIFRRPTDQHQVVVDVDLKREQKDQAPLTICLTGPVHREWGFWKETPAVWDKQNDGVIFGHVLVEDAKRVFVPWREYLGLPPDEKGRG